MQAIPSPGGKVLRCRSDLFWTIIFQLKYPNQEKIYRRIMCGMILCKGLIFLKAYEFGRVFFHRFWKFTTKPPKVRMINEDGLVMISSNFTIRHRAYEAPSLKNICLKKLFDRYWKKFRHVDAKKWREMAGIKLDPHLLRMACSSCPMMDVQQSLEVHDIKFEELHKIILKLKNEIELDKTQDKQVMQEQVYRIQQKVTQLEKEEIKHIAIRLKDLTTQEINIKIRLKDLEDDIDKIPESLIKAQAENREHFQEAKQDRHEKHHELKELQISIKTQQATSSGKIDEIHTIVKSQDSGQPKEPVWFDIKKPIESFTGRTKELEELHKLVQGSSSARKLTVISQITAISGLGGIGKSELSRKYAQEYREDYYNVIWISAEKYENLIDSFRRLAQNGLSISTKDKDGREQDINFITQRVYANEIVSKNKSLFIFDNAEQYRTTGEAVGIDNFLPQQLPTDANEPYLIITSRNKQWGEQIKVLPLGVFTKEEAKEFIMKILINDDTLEAEKLAEKLQYFPLALQQAVAYIKQTDTESKNLNQTYKISDYLQDYEQKTKELLNYPFPEYSSDAYTKTTFTTWKITFEKIQQKGHNRKVLEILNIMAYLAPDNIPNEIFLKLTDGELSDRDVGAGIQLLNQYSMIGTEDGMSNIHRLVQQVIRLELKEQGKEQEIINKTFTILEKNFPYKSDKVDYDKKRQLLPHLESFLSHTDNWLKENPEKKIQEIERKKNLLELMTYGYKEIFVNTGDMCIRTSLYQEIRRLDQEIRRLDLDLALHYAAMDNQLEVIQWLVKEKAADINITDNSGNTALHCAAMHGHLEVVQWLVKEKADFLRRNNHDTVLHQAVHSNNLEVIKLILEKIKEKCSQELQSIDQYINVQDNEGNTPLMWAVKASKINALTILLEYGVDIEVQNNNGMTVLHLAAKLGSMEIFKLLVNSGANTNNENIYGKTPLHFAAQEGWLDIVKYLIETLPQEKQVSVNVATPKGVTPLHFAAYRGQLDVAKYLIEKGAKVDAVDSGSSTPLHFAAGRGQLDVAKYLIKKGAKVDAVDSLSRTPLHFAAQEGRLDIVKYLVVKKQVDVNIAVLYNITPLHLAALRGQLEIAEYLINKRANINALGINNKTPLHFAAETNNLKLVEFLAKKGADINAEDKDGQTSLVLANERNHDMILKKITRGIANVVIINFWVDNQDLAEIRLAETEQEEIT